MPPTCVNGCRLGNFGLQTDRIFLATWRILMKSVHHRLANLPVGRDPSKMQALYVSVLSSRLGLGINHVGLLDGSSSGC